jgi:hypothetical protein
MPMPKMRLIMGGPAVAETSPARPPLEIPEAEALLASLEAVMAAVPPTEARLAVRSYADRMARDIALLRAIRAAMDFRD